MARSKFVYLESIRGLAAFMVVVHHFYLAFYPSPRGINAIRVLFSGAFAVQLFFVLSGFVLSLSYFRSQDRGIIASAATRRYFRLLLPVLASVLIAWGIGVAGGFQAVLPAVEVMGQPQDGWLGHQAFHGLSVVEVLKQGFYGVFFDYQKETSLNSSLWTIEIEMMGSFLVFAFLIFFGSYPRRFILYLILIFGLREHIAMVNFLLGVAICDGYTRLEKKGKIPEIPLFAALAMFVAGGGMALLGPNWIAQHLGVTLPVQSGYMTSAGIVLILIGAILSPHSQGFLEWKLTAALGRISFALYVIHGPILFSLGCGLYLSLRESLLSHGGSVAVTGVVYLAVTLALSWLLYLYADLPSIRLGRAVERWLKG